MMFHQEGGAEGKPTIKIGRRKGVLSPRKPKQIHPQIKILAAGGISRRNPERHISLVSQILITE